VIVTDPHEASADSDHEVAGPEPDEQS
jgi:hypothetical protein